MPLKWLFLAWLILAIGYFLVSPGEMRDWCPVAVVNVVWSVLFVTGKVGWGTTRQGHREEPAPEIVVEKCTGLRSALKGTRAKSENTTDKVEFCTEIRPPGVGVSKNPPTAEAQQWRMKINEAKKKHQKIVKSIEKEKAELQACSEQHNALNTAEAEADRVQKEHESELLRQQTKLNNLQHKIKKLETAASAPLLTYNATLKKTKEATEKIAELTDLNQSLMDDAALKTIQLEETSMRSEELIRQNLRASLRLSAHIDANKELERGLHFAAADLRSCKRRTATTTV
eukprot:TRINITY_DN771_c6_g1_i1.p1 TRINITY_DN771_c6_g1~~TRINITY_DN771_c6_g1_i1.p1  ORF type:complete len:293 (+),score=58.82 TRINITY_DN771_c6_g1_i1:23-880(+)